MPLHDSSYQHWDGLHRGIGWRRLVIAGNGLRACLQSKWMRHLMTICWVQSMAMAGILFLIGQLLVPDSVVVKWLGNLSPELREIGRGLMTWLSDHPEISVRTEQNLLFSFFCRPLLFFSLIGIALALPHLITRDLSSRAIIIYSSKAVGRLDYVMGKFGTLFGLLCLTWLAPLCVAWFVGNLLAPNWNFFWHSRAALENVLVYVLSSMVILSAVGLGVSAVASNEKAVIGVWLVLWLATHFIVSIPHLTRPWLKFCSFQYDLQQIQYAVFRLTDDLRLAQDNIPFFGTLLRGVRPPTYSGWEHPAITGAILAAAIMVVLAGLIIFRRVKPE